MPILQKGRAHSERGKPELSFMIQAYSINKCIVPNRMQGQALYRSQDNLFLRDQKSGAISKSGKLADERKGLKGVSLEVGLQKRGTNKSNLK